MPAKKAYSRKSRVDAELHREIAELIRDELTDPRVANVTVTRVDVAPDLRSARVLVSLLGDDATLKAAVEGLNHAAGRLRHRLGERLMLRVTPALRFLPDTQFREAERLSLLIREARAKDDSAHGEAADSGNDDAA